MTNQDFIKLLDILKTAVTPVSGQRMAQELGLSRVAFWKKIQTLRAMGYQIEGNSQGYVLRSEDVLESWEFAPNEPPVFHWPTIPSTMDKAWDLVQKGTPEGTLVIADTQTQGRGQGQKKWISDPGNLHFTLILKPDLPLSMIGPLVIESLFQICQLVRTQTGLDLTWKWPNDLMHNGRKVGGILAEARSSSGRLETVLLGVGINIKAAPILDTPAVALETIQKAPILRRPLVRDFRQEILKWQETLSWAPGRWENCCAHTGTWKAKTWEGSIIDGERFVLDQEARLKTKEGRLIPWGCTKEFVPSDSQP